MKALRPLLVLGLTASLLLVAPTPAEAVMTGSFLPAPMARASGRARSRWLVERGLDLAGVVALPDLTPSPARLELPIQLLDVRDVVGFLDEARPDALSRNVSAARPARPRDKSVLADRSFILMINTGLSW